MSRQEWESEADGHDPSKSVLRSPDSPKKGRVKESRQLRWQKDRVASLSGETADQCTQLLPEETRNSTGRGPV